MNIPRAIPSMRRRFQRGDSLNTLQRALSLASLATLTAGCGLQPVGSSSGAVPKLDAGVRLLPGEPATPIDAGSEPGPEITTGVYELAVDSIADDCVPARWSGSYGATFSRAFTSGARLEWQEGPWPGTRSTICD